MARLDPNVALSLGLTRSITTFGPIEGAASFIPSGLEDNLREDDSEDSEDEIYGEQVYDRQG